MVLKKCAATFLTSLYFIYVLKYCTWIWKQIKISICNLTLHRKWMIFREKHFLTKYLKYFRKTFFTKKISNVTYITFLYGWFENVEQTIHWKNNDNEKRFHIKAVFLRARKTLFVMANILMKKMLSYKKIVIFIFRITNLFKLYSFRAIIIL